MMMTTWFWLGIRAKEEEIVVAAIVDIAGAMCVGDLV